MISMLQRELLETVGAALFGRACPAVQSEAAPFIREALNQSVLLLASGAAADRSAWEQTIQAQYLQNFRVFHEHLELHERMTAAGIPYTTVKGNISAAYYPEPFRRSMGDVDFLVRPEDAERADRVLREAGFQKSSDSRPSEAAYRRKQSVWELHWKVSGIPEGPGGTLVDEWLSDTIETSRLTETKYGVYRAPDEFHHGLILLVHTARHLLNTGIGLRHLCDWAVFVQKIPDAEFTELFARKLQACGLWRYAQLLTQLCTRYLGCRACAWAGEPMEEALLECLMEDILSGGNFGKKDSQRINQAKLYTDTRSGVVSTSIPRQMLSTLAGKARMAMPICERVKVLYPVGAVYALARHGFRILRGERPAIRLGATFRGAKNRRALYKALALYERPQETDSLT